MYDFKDLPPRDPNRFYYVSRPELPVAGYDLTCDQFRHSSPVEEFNLLISVATKSARIETVNGMVEFRVEAANVSIPVVTRVTLVVKFSPKSTMSFISRILG